MIRIYDGNIDTDSILNREIQTYTEYEGTVRGIIADVRERGDAALLEYGRRFDYPDLDSLEVTRDEIEAAKKRVDPELLQVIKEAKDNIEYFHRNQLREGFRLEREGGIVLGQKYTPIEKVGIYVPGGTASYPSTVLMNAVPAKIAGVSEIVMTTPCGHDGRIRDEILCAADICGVDRIFKCGGAQAIAALAYGTESVPAVYKIVGPGNIFVAIAKKEVFGKVGIDMIAGPSEILIVADGSASPRRVAADMLSQAEHDRLATAVLVTDSRGLADSVSAELERLIPELGRRDIARSSIDNNGKIIIVPDIDSAIGIANKIAPEHLELFLEEPFDYLDRVKNAGSIFLGKNSPEPLGDYFAGPNHTLPTGGSAKFSSPLSVDDFVKKSSYLYYSEDALRRVKDKVAMFARSEGLGAHAESILCRFTDECSKDVKGQEKLL